MKKNNVFNLKTYLQGNTKNYLPETIGDGVSHCCGASCIDMNQEVQEDGTLESICADCKEWCNTLFIK